jgi:glycerol-3-phosphate acyltransferase PlsY
VGHMFPVFLRFRGGKGGATVIGILALLMPRMIPLGLGVFLLALLLTRYPTFSYSLALLCTPFVAWLKYHNGALVLFTVLLLMMVLVRYMPRLLEMRSTGGNWKRVFIRKGLKDRF